MTNIQCFKDWGKAQHYAQQYAQQHRVVTQIARDEQGWMVQSSQRCHGPTQLKPQPPQVRPQAQPESEQQRMFRFTLVEELMALTDPKAREQRLNALCSQWGGRLAVARKILRETGDQPEEVRPLSGPLRKRLRKQGIHQFAYLSAARRCAQVACQTAGAPHFAAVGKHHCRGDFWVFVDTLPRHGNAVDLIEIYRKTDSKTGWWCERLDTPSYIPTWDVELRDPATGDILHMHRKGMNGQTVALRVLSETPNFELVDVVQADADWADAVPYDTIEAIVADNEDEEVIQERLTSQNN